MWWAARRRADGRPVYRGRTVATVPAGLNLVMDAAGYWWRWSAVLVRLHEPRPDATSAGRQGVAANRNDTLSSV
jgi:hypothetical protein